MLGIADCREVGGKLGSLSLHVYHAIAKERGSNPPMPLYENIIILTTVTNN